MLNYNITINGKRKGEKTGRLVTSIEEMTGKVDRLLYYCWQGFYQKL